MSYRELTPSERDYVEQVLRVMRKAKSVAIPGDKSYIGLHIDAIKIALKGGLPTTAMAHSLLITAMAKGLHEDAIHALDRVLARHHMENSGVDFLDHIQHGSKITAVDISPNFDPSRN